MRHLLSLVLSLVLAPLVYVAAGLSAVKLADATAPDTLAVLPAIIGLAAAIVAGCGYAVLVMARLSPIGPMLAGLAFLGVTLWALLAHGSFSDTMPSDIVGVRGALHAPVGAGTALLSVPLLATVVSPRRWRESAEPAPATPYSAAPQYGPPPGSAAPTYEEPATTETFQTPIYQPQPPTQP